MSGEEALPERVPRQSPQPRRRKSVSITRLNPPIPTSHAASEELDKLFGESISPTRVDECERLAVPRSLHDLNKKSAKWLKDFMRVTQEGLGVTQYVYCEMPILWIVDHGGTVWFAVEEVLSLPTRDFAFPRLRRTPVPPDFARLGHPALIKAGAGRIGGEILFDPGGDTPSWCITNASGRYGLLAGRTASHLHNAKEAFGRFGIDLQDDFIPVG